MFLFCYIRHLPTNMIPGFWEILFPPLKCDSCICTCKDYMLIYVNTVYCQHPHTDPLRAYAISQNQKMLSTAVWFSPVHPGNKLVCYHCSWEEREGIGVRGVIYDGALSFHLYLALCLAQQICWSPMKLPLLMQLYTSGFQEILPLVSDLSYITTLMSFHLLTWRIHMVGAGKWTWILRRKSQCS